MKNVRERLALALGAALGTPGLELLMYELAGRLIEQLDRGGLTLVDTTLERAGARPFEAGGE